MTRFLLIGLDGAEPSLVEPWMDEGRLPNLAGLRERGGYLRCDSTTPPVTFPAWMTCVTGVNPGRHGIFDFTNMKTGEYAIEFVNSRWREAPAIWDTLSQAEKRSCVLGVPGTYPPGKIDGVMVSGFDSPVCTGVDRSFVHPHEIYEEVKDWRFADFQESHIGPGWHDVALPKLLQGVETKERIATRLLQREPWDFFMVVFGESDTVSHHFWLFHDPNSPRHRPGHEDAIRQVYERLDEAVGTLIEAAGDDVVVGVVSDHGFGGAGTGVVHLNNWLAEEGFLEYLPARESVLKKTALSITPERWRGALFRRFQNLASRAESHSRFAGIDWAKTSAWSDELNYLPSIRVNLKGREPEGQVEPEQYESFCRELCERLEQWHAVQKAWRREELYSGPFVDRAPDIILELTLEDGYSHSVLRDRAGKDGHGPSFRRLNPGEHLGGKERGMNGAHRPTGIFFLSEPVEASHCSLLDVAPTIYSAMDEPGPEMEGRSLLGGVSTATVSAPAKSESAYTPEQEAAVEQRLRDLGYFE